MSASMIVSPLVFILGLAPRMVMASGTNHADTVIEK